MIRQADEQRGRRLPGLAALLGIAVLLWTTGAGAEPQAAPSGETRPGLEPAVITVAALPFRPATDEDRYTPLAAVLADLLMARLAKPVTAGSTVHFQYSVPAQVEEPGSLPRTSYRSPVGIKLTDMPPAPLTPENLPGRWTADMDLVYREFAGLGGPERRVHVDGRGHVTLVDCSGFGRVETTLPQTRLDALAARLRRMKVWELSDFRPPSGPLDAGEIRFSLASGGASLIGYYSLLLTREEQVLAALQAEMMALIDAALARAAEEAKRKVSDEQIKATAAEIHRKLHDGGKKMWEAGQ